MSKFTSGKGRLLGFVAVGLVVVAGLVTRAAWWPKVRDSIQTIIASRQSEEAAALAGDDHHDHAAESPKDHAAHTKPHADEAEAAHDHDGMLELSPQALASMGLTKEYIKPVKRQSFRRKVNVPGMVVGRPGRTQVHVSTPIAGVITHVHALTGEAVSPGSLLLELRITGDELVETQTTLLKSLGELDVENREIERLTKALSAGIIPEKALLEHQYAAEKLRSQLVAERESLRLHGLSERQVSEIENDRRLLKDLQIVVPSRDAHPVEELRLTQQEVQPASYVQPADGHAHDSGSHSTEAETPLVISEMYVHKGQQVAAGELLCELADYAKLHVQGQAFEQDLRWLLQAAQAGTHLSAVVPSMSGNPVVLKDLELVYTGNEIDPETRTLPFFVGLSNEIVRDVHSADGQRFVDWRFRPGQRMQLQIPEEELTNVIVLPPEAVAIDGAEAFVFEQHDGHFAKIAIEVKYKDATTVVVAPNAALPDGTRLVHRGAHQMLLAIKNQAGGGAEAHHHHD